jgi:DNA-directed RNA polymerase specialized sigma24 family protein
MWMIKKNGERDKVSKDDLMLAELRTANRLLAILATRGMEQREAIALLLGMSFTPRAIAAALSMTSNAVSVAIHRMKKAEQPATEKMRGAPAAAAGEVEPNG